MFEPDALNPWLDDPRLRAAVTTAGTVTSTNVILKKSVQNGGPLPQILIADQQTAGVGRHGKHFASPADAGLYISYAFHPQINRALITPAAGVALQQAIADQFGISTQIKWVNDLQK
ncbi:MAG: biotin--[acetyl-CoA-carboxylase] ligase, partial [Lacticaseibacillus paracasei]